MDLIKAIIECSHCQHQLEGQVRFGLDLVRCSNCLKFTKVESHAVTTKINAKPTIDRSVTTREEIAEV